MHSMSSQNFEAEIRKQIEEKKAQKLREQLIDQQLTLNQYKNYPLSGNGENLFDIDSREQKLLKMMLEHGVQAPGTQNGVAFRGDMNRAVSNHDFDSKPANIFDDQFLRKVNENHNISNNPSSFNQHTDMTKMSERERRIFLRDKERERRNQVQTAGIATNAAAQSEQQYGGGFQGIPTHRGNQDIFDKPTEPQIMSKRDQVWAQKAMQRQALPPAYSLPPAPYQAVNQTPDAGNLFAQSPIQDISQKQPSHSTQPAQTTPRTSMQAIKLKQAIDLDISMNKNLNDDVVVQNQVFGQGQEEKRNQQNALRKQEYNELLAQQAKKQLQREGSQTQSDPLVLGGLSQIGDHQYKQTDEKQRRQLEYKKMLENQLNQKSQLKPPVDGHRQKIADDLFNQVINLKQPEQNAAPQKLAVGGAVRALSAVGSNRQHEMAKLQMQETKNPFFASRNKEDAEKQRQLDKKKEYAAELQLQMQMKKAEQQKLQDQRQRRNLESNHPPDQRLPIHHNAAIDQLQQVKQTQQFQAPSLDHQYKYGPSEIPDQFGYGGVPVQDQFRYMGSDNQNDQYSKNNAMPPRYTDFQVLGTESAIDARQPPRNSKEEYRKQLEIQMKELNEKKQRQKEEQMKYEMRNDKDLADWITLKPDAGPQVRKGATDITRLPKQEDERQINARLKYQEELRQQIEEQKQRKETQQRQAKIEDEQDEQRYIQERQRIAGRERQEIKQEGGKVDNEKPKRQIRRDQFEPSQENPAFNPKQLKPVTELFQNSPPNPIDIIKTPTSSLLDDQANQMMFAQNNFHQMPPVGRPQPFLLEDQSQHPFNVQPHPQHSYQPSTPFSYSAMPSALPSSQQFFQQQQQPTQTQSDWSQQQASKMFEDQQKMIQLYQQALEQILKYRNQYFEQAMEMRENILKEREQLLEFEKLKQQQLIEMQQIQTLKHQLGSVRANQQPLSANVQHNLDRYIVQQKQQILQLSQSQSQMQQLMSSQQPMFTVETSRVEIDRMRQDYTEENHRQIMSPGAVSIGYQVAEQVDEIAEHIERIAGQQFQSEQDFEESLSSNTKLVKVPQNNLASKAKQMKSSPMRVSLNNGREDALLATWDEASLNKIQPVTNSQNQSVAKPMPFQRKDIEIPEVPDEDKMQSPMYKERKGMSDAQFNDRDSSDERNQHRTIDSHVSRKKQLSASGMIERKATVTGSSFYDQTLKNQKLQAETQQVEMQKQLMRIFGNTQTSAGLVKVLDENLNHDEVETPSLHEIIETIDQGEREDDNQPSDINIAHTRTEHFDQQDDSSNDLGKNTSRFVNEGRASDFKPRGSQEFLRAQQEMMRSQPMQSGWDDNDDSVPVVSQHLLHTQFSNQMASEYNFQVQEEEMTERTLNYLKMMNPDVLETSGTQKFQVVTSPVSNQQLEQKEEDDQEMKIQADQIEEEIYTSCDEEHTQHQQSAVKASVTTSNQQEILSKKEREIKEIEALLRKVQTTTNNAIEAASRKKEQSKTNTSLKKPNKMVEDEIPSHPVQNLQQEDDTNILADLDRIINNLELQQKNMATFGIVDHYDDEEQDQSKPDTKQRPQRTQWRTLQEARQERPTTGKSTGKAPLVPKRPNEELSKSKISQRIADSSPNQRVGKFSQMALMNQTNNSDQSRDRSLNSKSPQRIGKFTQMALDTSFKSKRSQENSVSPSQTLGKFAQMALNKNQHDLSEDDIQNISQKYSRGPSKERENSKSQSSLIPVEVGQVQSSILRPVSGSHSSRYQMAKQSSANQRPFSTVQANQKLMQQQQYNNTPGGQTTITSRHQQQYYFSDEEENGQTEGTQKFTTNFGHQVPANRRIVCEDDQL